MNPQGSKENSLGSSRLREACHPCVGLRASMGSMLCGVIQYIRYIILIINNKTDNKTTTIDYKRLINGLVLTEFPSLQQQTF